MYLKIIEKFITFNEPHQKPVAHKLKDAKSIDECFDILAKANYFVSGIVVNLIKDEVKLVEDNKAHLEKIDEEKEVDELANSRINQEYIDVHKFNQD